MSVLCVKLEPEATLNHVGDFCMSVSQCPAEWSLSLSDVCDFHLVQPAPLSHACGLVHPCMFQRLILLVWVLTPSLWSPSPSLSIQRLCVVQVKACVQISVCNYSDNRAKRSERLILSGANQKERGGVLICTGGKQRIVWHSVQHFYWIRQESKKHWIAHLGAWISEGEIQKINMERQRRLFNHLLLLLYQRRETDRILN